jgi:hypothetical protein
MGQGKKLIVLSDERKFQKAPYQICNQSRYPTVVYAGSKVIQKHDKERIERAAARNPKGTSTLNI